MGCGCNKKKNTNDLINRASQKQAEKGKKTTTNISKLPLVSIAKKPESKVKK
jgi:hypothetical protein